MATMATRAELMRRFEADPELRRLVAEDEAAWARYEACQSDDGEAASLMGEWVRAREAVDRRWRELWYKPPR